MNLAVFDLDHTLLNGDSDYLWGQFLVANRLVDAEYYARENQRFYDEYAAGSLDIHAFAAFSLRPLMALPLAQLEALRERFVAEQIVPVISVQAPALLEHHRQAGDELLITTATNRFIVEPIAAHLGVAHLLATEPERDGPRFTGRIARSNFRDAKVTNLKAWLAAHPVKFERLSGYSDSQNDLPLLEFVDHPHAVDADPVLRAAAEARGWPVISLR
ncbi:MAG: HAD family phosphatase [Nevskia sp.]|nr:HAD family phosphatase [Nevskia sp.]